nr:MAG TPA: hypothetical protein [Caudoviricetes sp.]
MTFGKIFIPSFEGIFLLPNFRLNYLLKCLITLL